MVHFSHFLTTSKLPFYLANNPKNCHFNPIWGPNGLPMGKSIPFYKQKYCTTHFTQFLNLFYPKNGNFKTVKKWPKWTILGLILGLSPLQGILGPHWVTYRWGHHLAWIRDQLQQDWSSGGWDNLIKLELGGVHFCHFLTASKLPFLTPF